MNKRTNTAVWIEKNSRWQINVQKDCVRKTFVSSKPGRTGQREANAKADKWLESNVVETTTKVTELLDKYLENVKIKTSLGNYKKEKSNTENYIRKAIGNKKIERVTVQNLQDIVDKAYKNKERTLSKKTLQSIRATIMSFYKYCRKSQVTNLYPDIDIPKSARLLGKTILQPNDIKALFEIDTTILYGKRVFDEYVYAYRFQLLTGLRPGELRGITEHDIRDKILTINRAINIDNEITQGKNANALRKIYLSDTAYEIIQLQLKLHHEKYIFNIDSESTYRHRWQKYCESNNITVISPYELRHTFVSIIKQMPEGTVKQVVGHSKNMDTFGIYGHDVDGEQKQIANEINNIFEQIIPKK